MVEDQDMPGRSRNRVLEDYRNILRTRSGSTHSTLGTRKESNGRRAPTTILTVFYNNTSTNTKNENFMTESQNSNENINLGGDRFSQPLVSCGIEVSPEPLSCQRAREKHKIHERARKSKHSSTRKPSRHRRLALDYGNDEIVDYGIQDDLPLETMKFEDANTQDRFYRYGNPDNSFRGLQSSESADLNNVLSDLSIGDENRTNATTPSSVIASAANKIYSRMSKIFTGDPNSLYSISRVSSCYTLKGNEQPNNKKVTRKNSLDATIRTGSIKYESELDDEDAEPNGTSESETEQEIDNKHDADKNKNLSDNINDSRRVAANAINYKETLQEINDFQSNFVKKYNNATPTPIGNSSQKSTSRTLQKILDYKDLYSEEEDSTKSTSNGIPLSKWHPLIPGSSSFEYGIKIQHEAIMSEYTQIKLRFSSSLSGSSSETYSIPNEKISSKLKMRSNTGVLGFIDRSRYIKKYNDSHEKGYNLENSDSPTNISEDADFPIIDSKNKDSYVSQIWKNETDRMFPSPDSIPSCATYTDTPNVEPPRKMSIDLRSEDCDIYENKPNHSHNATRSIDLSQMARNVRFNRYS